VLDYDYYFRLTEAALENNVSRNMLLLNEIMSKGFDGQQILSGLAVFFRDLLVCKDPQTIVLFETGDAVKNKYIELAARCDTAFLYKAIELANETDLSYRLSKNKRLSVELLLIRLCQLNSPRQEDDKKKIVIEPIVSNETTPVQKETETKTVSEIPVNEPLPESGKKQDKPVSAGKTVARIGMKDSPAKEDDKQEEKKETTSVYNETFTKEDLIVAWKRYAHATDDIHLKNTMLYITPELNENNRVEITVLNPEQEHKFQEKGLDIKEFLFTQLNNNQIVLEVKVNENDSNQMLFTDKEKYTYMVDKNPSLNKLAQEFNLRLD
jgi:DNA polymerase-3 subunit gamma/tau